MAYCYEEVRNYGKMLSKTLLKMADGGDAYAVYPHPPWIHPWLCNNKIWLQIQEICFKLKIPMKAIKARLLQGSQRNAF